MTSLTPQSTFRRIATTDIERSVVEETAVTAHNTTRFWFTAGLLVALTTCFDTLAMAYESVPVKDGATVRGTVTVSGTIPSPQEFELRRYPDYEYCSKVSDKRGHRLLREVTVRSNGGLKDAVVVVEGVERGKPFTFTNAEVNVKLCQFLPFVTVVSDARQLTVFNRDPVPHDMQGSSHDETGGELAFYRPVLQAEGTTDLVRLSKGRHVFIMQCSIHPYMQNWGYTVDHPYFAVTDATGAFSIENLPPGTYRLKVWHPILGTREKELTVTSNQLVSMELSFGKSTERPATTTEASKSSLAKEVKGVEVASLPSHTLPQLISAPIELIGKDGVAMVLIPGGEFIMGSEEKPDERPSHPVFLDDYLIDIVEVTTGLYRKFLVSTRRDPPYKWDDAIEGRDDNKPVIGVTYHDAAAYCRWVEKRLPTEAEWEKAARGIDQRKFPWGNDEPSELQGNFGRCCGWKGYSVLKIVGSTEQGISPYGVHDLAGNVWEWVADWYAPDYYKKSPSSNPPGPSTGDRKVIRGGSWSNTIADLRVTARDRVPPAYKNMSLGFRCAGEFQSN